MSKKWGVGLLIACLGVLVMAMPAGAVTPTSNDGVNPNHCFSGADSGGLTKSLVSVANNNDGTWTLTFRIVSPLGAGTYDKLDDCAFVDVGNNRAYDGETPVFTREIKPVTLGAGGTYQFTIVVAGAANATVCDRAALSGSAGGSDFTDKSNLLCVPLTASVIPSGTVGGLGFAALVAGGVGALALLAGVRRRRHAIAAV